MRVTWRAAEWDQLGSFWLGMSGIEAWGFLFPKSSQRIMNTLTRSKAHVYWDIISTSSLPQPVWLLQTFGQKRNANQWTSQLPLSLSNHVILTNSLSLTFNFSTSKRRKIALSTHKVAAMPNIKSLSATNVLYIWYQFNPESLLWRISSPGYRWGSWGSETWLTSNRNSLGWA